ncbi:MAG: hypothetical protein MUE40_13875 [Anaerolineae bacterium]|nr:hypothetical protein [Anaerolineae bacterium]
MTIQVEWLIPQRILYTRMLDDITREDLQAYDLELLNRLASATAPGRLTCAM